jgi:hypothetical protein
MNQREAFNASYARTYKNPACAKCLHFSICAFGFFLALFSFRASFWLVVLITPLLTWVAFLIGDQFLDKKDTS